MLEIGINEDWRLGPESKVTDKGGINIHFIKGEATESALELLDEEFEEGESSNILLFPPNMTNYKEETARTSIELIRDITTDYHRMYAIFNLYFTKDELKKIYPISSIMEGLNITAENEKTMLTQESVIKKIYENLGAAITKVINTEKMWEKDMFRIKLLRQSPKKAFPRFTYKPKFGDWVELMTIPKEQSKVAFTSFEKSKGYDDPTIASDVIDPDGGDNEFDEDALPPTEDNIPEAPAEEEVNFE